MGEYKPGFGFFPNPFAPKGLYALFGKPLGILLLARVNTQDLKGRG